MKLYFAPRTAAIRSRWLLEELGIPYELVRLDLSRAEHRVPEFPLLNPLGELPVLVDEPATLAGAAAVALYLADRFPESGLAPAIGSPQRGPYLHWLMFAEATLVPVVMEHRQRALSAGSQAPEASARFEELVAVVDAQLEGRAFVASDAFTAADVSLASILHLAHTLKLLETKQRLLEYVQRQTSRPASRRAVSG